MCVALLTHAIRGRRWEFSVCSHAEAKRDRRTRRRIARRSCAARVRPNVAVVNHEVERRVDARHAAKTRLVKPNVLVNHELQILVQPADDTTDERVSISVTAQAKTKHAL